ncbi:MAG: hydrogenase formation protein HypD [Acidobacteria bacterium]|nr:hydrogenase formation protein HypD [Acidobacteriota bacterium]
MKHLDEYRDARLVRITAGEIRGLVTRPWVLMEVCGGQTHTIMRYGLPDLLPPEVEFVHGPGCPVCVTALETMDRAMAMAARPGVIFACYGDMMRVPGSRLDLFRVKAAGGDIRIVYSPMDALKLARDNPHREVVFFGVGFETTAPANAMAAHAARRDGVGNFSMLASHVLVPPAVRAILGAEGNRVQGLIAPGHVCTVMGYREYEELSAEYGIPIVVAGFEPLDLLAATLMLARQLEQGQARLENQYSRSVTRDGNAAARRLMDEVFETADRKWRGIGRLPLSGLRMRGSYDEQNAEVRFETAVEAVEEPSECISAMVLRGRAKPTDCPAFGGRCTPRNPMGAPMVSTEGACAAYYHFRRTESEGEL